MEPIVSGDWPGYNRLKQGTSVPATMQLPARLLMVCKGLKKMEADFFAREPDQWVVSQAFFTFIQAHNLFDNQYDYTALSLVDTKGKSITSKDYVLVRFTKTNDELVSLESSPFIPSAQKPLTKTSPKRVFYTDLIVKEPQEVPGAFILDVYYFWNTFLCQESVKEAMEAAGFLGIEYYTIAEFAQESRVREAAYSVEEYQHFKQQAAAGNQSGFFSKDGLIGPLKLS